MSNIINRTLHRIVLNQNPVDGEPQKSAAHGGNKWAHINSKYGRTTTNYMELAFGLGVVKNYFASFLDPENNLFAGSIVKSLNALSGFFSGKRDEGMYDVYTWGQNSYKEGYLIDEDLKDQTRAINRVGLMDDALENKRQEVLFGEKVIPKLWEWAGSTAKLKPIMSIVSGFLGNSYRTTIDTLLDFPARILWRARFFTSAFHGNFVTTATNLATSWTKSFFSNSGKNEFNQVINDIKDKAIKYFEAKGKNKNEFQNKSAISLYAKMLKDRMGEHLNGFRNPEKVLKEKVDREFFKTTTEEERAKDPSKSLDQGYVAIDPETGKVSKQDCAVQSRASFTDFTGPICAGLGLVGTVIFDPLKCIWGIAGIEKGKNLINALSASRKSFSLFNYLTRFILQEKEEGSHYKKMEELIKNNPESEALSELYKARKERYRNGLLGVALTVGNILEPYFHLRRSAFAENKFFNFLFNNFVSFNDDFFLRFFSKRRECLGRIEHLRSMAQNILDKDYITDEDYSEITNEQLNRAYKINEQNIQGEKAGFLDTYSIWFSKIVDELKKAWQGGKVEETPVVIRNTG